MKEKETLWNKNFSVACIANFLIACSFNLLVPVIPLYLTEVLHIPETNVGIVLSSYVLAMLFMRPFSGYMVDIFPRKALYIIGLSLFVTVYLGYYLVTAVLAFVIVRFIHGVFWGITSVSANTVVIDIIPASRRAEGIGFFGMFNNLALAIAPYIALNIYHSAGFHWLVTSAIGMGVIAIIFVSFISVPVRPKSVRPPLSFDRFILLPALPVLINQIIMTSAWGTLIPFAALYGKSIGIQNSGILFLFLAFGIIVSRIFSGKMVDKGYIHPVIISALLIAAIGFVVYSQVHMLVAFCVSVFVVGVGFGMLLPALQTIYVNMATHDRRGTASSTYLTGFDVGNGIGMLTGGYIISLWSFQTLYIIAAATCLLGIIVYLTSTIWVYTRKKLVE
ncbi:MAG TPA: MFS transporter [Paludibacteraceae bacterium]|nr:MFS transporter [Paludibacteraceae bacterium]HPT43096.1 MFS transporter [Paludibacteraceae bacterium]